jgi:hypothetical protein
MTDQLALLMASLTMASAPQAISTSGLDEVATIVCAPRDGGMCAALTGALKRTGRKVQIAPPHSSRAPTRGDLTIAFVEEGRSAEHIVGHLAWTTANGAESRGESLRCSVVDARVSDAILRSYADTLVHHARLPD